MLTQQQILELITAVANTPDGNAIATAINTGVSVAAQSGLCIPAAIVATSTSETVDFGALQVGDLVVRIPATAGNAIFYTVATAGTLPAAAVVGDLYVVLRVFVAPEISAVTP